MDFVVDNIHLIPVVTGLVEVIKRMGLPPAWCPTASLILGIATGVLFLTPDNPALGVLGGVVIGLSATGLYSGTKNTIQVVANKS